MIRLRLLGETVIDVDGTPVAPDSQVLFAALLVLALERGKRLARSTLYRLLWPDAGEESGRHNLRQVAYKLRQLGAPLDSTQNSLMLPASEVGGELVELLAGGGAGGSAVAARLAHGRRLGELLPGYAPTFSAAFADWVDEQRGLLHAQLRRALLAAMGASRHAGRWQEVEGIAREVLRFDALNEEATLALAEATALAGAKAEALDIIDRYVKEVGGKSAELRVPASVLRRRIAERLPVQQYSRRTERQLFGREKEMEDLLQAWYSAKEGHGAGIVLWGEPGIGKSRLAHEVGQVAILQGARVVRVACKSWDVGRPLGAIVDLVPQIQALPGAAGVTPESIEYLGRLTKHDPYRPATAEAEPSAIRRSLKTAFLDLVDAVQMEQPLLLAIDDVQWLDPTSWEVVAALSEHVRRMRVLLTLTSREETPAHLPDGVLGEELRRKKVGALSQSAASELLDAVTRESGRYMSPDDRDWYLPLACGNPLHVQEVALHWLDTGTSHGFPSAIRDSIEARIGRLSDHSQLLLEICALIGRSVRLDWLEHTSLLTLREALDATRELDRAHLLVCADESVWIRHPLIADIISAQSNTARRTVLHRKLAQALESSAYASADASLIWEAAAHWSKAGRERQAFNSLIRCAQYLNTIGMSQEAIATLHLAMDRASDDASRELTSAQIGLAFASANAWDSAHQWLSRQPLSPAVRPSGPVGPAALKLLESRWRRQESLSELIREALALTSGPAHDDLTRLQAATFALILCDNRDGCLSEYEQVEHIVDELLASKSIGDIEKYRHKMILHSLRLDAIGAGRHAELLLEAAQSASRPEWALVTRQAAQALRVAGKVSVAVDALKKVLYTMNDSAQKYRLVEAAMALATSALYSEEPSEALSWLDLADDAALPEQDLMAIHSHCYIGVQAFSQLGTPKQLRAIRDRLVEPVAAAENSRLRMAIVVTRMRVSDRMLEPEDPTTSSLSEELLVLTRRHLHRGQVDFMVSTCLRALMSSGREEDACHLLTDYLSNARLERCLLHADLEITIQQFGFPLGTFESSFERAKRGSPLLRARPMIVRGVS